MPIFRRRFQASLALAMLALALAACSSRDTDTEIATGPAVLSAGEIQTILAGKSWRFVGPNNTGTTLYASDGTSLVEVDGKGKTKGRWQAQDGQLCESFEPAPFLPGGVPMSCYAFSATGSPNTYQVGKATFSLAS
jgi:hypothetical protein